MPDRIDVKCPCCDTKLVVDVDSGAILSEERPKITDRTTFDAAVAGVRAGAAKRQRAFEDAFDRTRKQEDVLEKKFEEARKKAAKDPDKKPRNPLDFD